MKDGVNTYNGKGRLYLKNGNSFGDKWFYGKVLESDELPTIPSGKFGLNLTKKGGVFQVVGIITNGQHVLSKNFILDTGASLVVLPWSTVVELKNQNIITSSDFYEGSISLTTANGDKMEGKKFKIRQINFEFKTPDGQTQIISLKNVEAVVNSSESERRKSIYGLSNAPTLLGQSALEQFKKFELDFEQNLLLISNP
jgi:predicted aspartyl protease